MEQDRMEGMNGDGRWLLKGGSLALSRERGCDHRSGYGGGEGISYGRRHCTGGVGVVSGGRT